MASIAAPQTDIEIPPHIQIRTAFPEMPKDVQEMLIEILEIRAEIATRGTHINPDGVIDTTVNPQRKRYQEVGLVRGRQINDATTEDSLNLETTQWREQNGLWAVARESEIIGVTSQKFQANLGRAIRDRFSVARVTTKGRDVPGFGFGVGSMRHLVSDSMPIDARNITPQTEMGPSQLEVESFDGQNLMTLLERFKYRLRAAL